MSQSCYHQISEKRSEKTQEHKIFKSCIHVWNQEDLLFWYLWSWNFLRFQFHLKKIAQTEMFRTYSKNRTVRKSWLGKTFIRKTIMDWFFCAPWGVEKFQKFASSSIRPWLSSKNTDMLLLLPISSIFILILVWWALRIRMIGACSSDILSIDILTTL